MNNNATVIAWWSGGITSAVTCKLCVDMFGPDNVRVVFIDTRNEHKDTYRFKDDCSEWYGVEIETITNENYQAIEEVWLKYLSLNVAHGAICSSELKRAVREKFQRENDYDYQAFGFEFNKREFNRSKSMNLNHPDSKPIFPLLMYGLSKEDCIEMVEQAGIDIPAPYQFGYRNNNCFQTGCIQGGIGYWQLVRRMEPDKFYRMAVWEHLLTELKGEPVTMLKDQSNEAKKKEPNKRLVFLVPHPDYPELKDISQMDGREPEPLMECNGFCGTNDLTERSESEQDINFQSVLEFA